MRLFRLWIIVIVVACLLGGMLSAVIGVARVSSAGTPTECLVYAKPQRWYNGSITNLLDMSQKTSVMYRNWRHRSLASYRPPPLPTINLLDEQVTGQRFSPDGSKLAYITTNGVVSSLYLLEIGKSKPERIALPLVAKSANDSFLGWSPDGVYLHFALRIGYYDRVVILNYHTRELVLPAGAIINLDGADLLIWSPDSQVLYMAVAQKGKRLVVAYRMTKQHTDILAENFYSLYGERAYTSDRWKLFATNRKPAVDPFDKENLSIHFLDLYTGQVIQWQSGSWIRQGVEGRALLPMESPSSSSFMFARPVYLLGTQFQLGTEFFWIRLDEGKRGYRFIPDLKTPFYDSYTEAASEQINLNSARWLTDDLIIYNVTLPDGSGAIDALDTRTGDVRRILSAYAYPHLERNVRIPADNQTFVFRSQTGGAVFVDVYGRQHTIPGIAYQAYSKNGEYVAFFTNSSNTLLVYNRSGDLVHSELFYPVPMDYIFTPVLAWSVCDDFAEIGSQLRKTTNLNLNH